MLTMPPSLFNSAKTGMPLSFSVISSGVSAVGATEGAAGGAASSAPPRRLSTKGSSRGRERTCSEGALVASARPTIDSIARGGALDGVDQPEVRRDGVLAIYAWLGGTSGQSRLTFRKFAARAITYTRHTRQPSSERPPTKRLDSQGQGGTRSEPRPDRSGIIGGCGSACASRGAIWRPCGPTTHKTAARLPRPPPARRRNLSYASGLPLSSRVARPWGGRPPSQERVGRVRRAGGVWYGAQGGDARGQGAPCPRSRAAVSGSRVDSWPRRACSHAWGG